MFRKTSTNSFLEVFYFANFRTLIHRPLPLLKFLEKVIPNCDIFVFEYLLERKSILSLLKCLLDEDI